MKKPSLICLATLVLLVFAVFLLSCEKNYITQAQEEHVGDYHLLYNYIWGMGSEENFAWALEFSTKTSEIIDSIKTPFIIADMRYSTDGEYAVYWVISKNNNKTIITINNLTGDTLASTSGNYGGELFLSPDEHTLMTTNGGNFALLSFPNLDSIYVEEIWATSGGFMTDGKTAFYMVSDVDSLFFIDYSDPENIIKTSTPIKSYGSPAYPVSAVVDYQNERLLLVCEHAEGYTYIHIHDSNDFSKLNELDLLKRYRIRPVIRPGTDEVYLGSYIYHDPGNGYVDVYNFKTNVVTSLMKGEDIRITAAFDPIQLEFTPDGNRLYILNGATIPPNMVLGVNPLNGSIIQQFGPAQGYAIGDFIRINPIDFSE